MDFIKNNDCWEEEGYGKYPILESDQFVYMKYSNEDSETCKDLIMNHLACGSNYFLHFSSLHRFCNDCNCDEDRNMCYLYNQYYFTEIKCFKSKEVFYLVTNNIKPWITDEKDWFFIPAHPFNVEIFNAKYLNSLHRTGY